MAVIWTPRQPWRRQPDPSAEINPDHPLARNLAWVWSGRGGYLTWPRSYPYTVSNPVVPRAVSAEIPFGYDSATGSALEWSNLFGSVDRATVSMSAWVICQDNTIDSDYIVQNRSASQIYGSSLRTRGATGGAGTLTAIRQHFTVSTQHHSAAGFLPTNVVTHVAAVIPSTTWYPNLLIYVNGREVTYNDGTYGSGTEQALTGVHGIGGNSFVGQIADARCWFDRALTASEIWSLYDPATRWDLYRRPASRRLYLDLGAGGIEDVPVTAYSGTRIEVVSANW